MQEEEARIEAERKKRELQEEEARIEADRKKRELQEEEARIEADRKKRELEQWLNENDATLSDYEDWQQQQIESTLLQESGIIII